MFIPSYRWSIMDIASDSRSPPQRSTHRIYLSATPISKMTYKNGVKRLRSFSLRGRIPVISQLQYHVFFPKTNRCDHHVIQNVPWMPNTMKRKNLKARIRSQSGLKKKTGQ